MAWEPLPQRRIVLENARFVYAFGNTRQSSLLTSGQGEEHRALLLGFGDPRHVLATGAACALRAPPPRRLSFDLCDIGPLNVARGVLLMHLASTIDPSNQDDLAFIWGVQYCLRLSAAHSQRLAAAVRELLADPRALRDQAGDAGTAAVLERVLRGWVEGAPRGVAEVEEERRRLLAARLSTKAGRRVSTAEDMRAVYQGQAEAAVASVLPWPRRGSSDVCLSNPTLAAECVEFFMTGTIYGDADSGGKGDGWAVNPTLLQPGSRAWLLHYGALPFLAFMPLNPGRHAGLAAASGPRALTRACLAELATTLRGWQACRAACTVQARFWCCDALALCARLAVPAGEEAAPEEARFDAIDASNLPDQVGTLSLLAVAAPLLRLTPHARLWTTHMLWTSGGGGALPEYLRLATGASDTRLLPTLLGLRLVADPTYGLEQPMGFRARYGQSDVQNVVEWAPAPLAPAALPTLTDADGIAAALRAWGDLACGCRAAALMDRSGLHFALPLALLHLVAGLGARAQRLLPPGTATWRQLADALADACAVPESYRLQLRALCCWALQPEGGGGGQPLLVRGRLRLSAFYHEAAEKAATPLLSLHLVSIPRDATLPAMLAELLQLAEQAGASPPTAMLRHMHILDVLFFDPASEEVAFLLPPDHGMASEGAAVSLVDGIAAQPLSTSPTPLASFDVSPFEQRAPAALAAGLRRLLERSAAAADEAEGGGAGGGSASGMHLSDGLQLRRLAEHADRFELELAVAPGLQGVSSKGLDLAFPDAPPGGGAGHQVELTLAPPARLRARLSLPWPVEGVAASVRVQRSTRTITVTLPKALMWLARPADMPSVDVGALPDWGSDDDARGELSTHLALMFSHEEQEVKQQRGGSGPDSSAVFQAKDSVQAMFVLFFLQGVHMHMVRSTAAAAGDEAALTVFVHPGVRRLPDGRPLLHVSCVDHERALRMFPSMASRAAPVARFSAVIRKLGGMGQPNSLHCTPQEIRLLRALLHHNAAALRVPSWQSSLLGLPSEWTASFLVPLYSDWLSGPERGESLLNAMQRSIQGREEQPRQGPGACAHGTPGAGGSSAALAAGTRHKEAGNAAFKARRFAAAVQEYLDGVRALGAAAGSPERRLRQDLANNMALAAIKHAEVEPAAAPRLLLLAGEACGNVLRGEPGNSKARYRRALVRHRQGRPREAAADLAAIPRDEADAAVAALQVEVDAALRRQG